MKHDFSDVFVSFLLFSLHRGKFLGNPMNPNTLADRQTDFGVPSHDQTRGQTLTHTSLVPYGL